MSDRLRWKTGTGQQREGRERCLLQAMVQAMDRFLSAGTLVGAERWSVPSIHFSCYSIESGNG